MIYSLQTKAWLSWFSSGQDQTMAEEAEDEVGLRPYFFSKFNSSVQSLLWEASVGGQLPPPRWNYKEKTMAIFYFMIAFGTSYFLLLVFFWWGSSQTKQIWLIFSFSILFESLSKALFYLLHFSIVTLFWCLSPPYFCWWTIFYFLPPWFALSTPALCIQW